MYNYKLYQKKEEFMNALDLFLVAPNQETFKAIQGNAWMLTRVFQKDKEHAKKYFKFEEWLKICQDLNGFNDEEKKELKDLLKSSVLSFDDAKKYHFSLPYSERVDWRDEFIKHANCVKDLRFVLDHIDKPNQKEYEIYRTKIVTKMREVAITDEDKKIAFGYVIWW